MAGEREWLQEIFGELDFLFNIQSTLILKMELLLQDRIPPPGWYNIGRAFRITQCKRSFHRPYLAKKLLAFDSIDLRKPVALNATRPTPGMQHQHATGTPPHLPLPKSWQLSRKFQKFLNDIESLIRGLFQFVASADFSNFFDT